MKRDAFDDFAESLSITKQKVLDVLEEWSLYCYYLSEAYEIPDFEPEQRKAYTSPIREDDDDDKPSFSVYEARTNGLCQYVWKDSGKRKSGNIFYLVSLLYGLTKEEDVLRKIDSDFATDLFPDNPQNPNPPKLITKPKTKDPAVIRILSKPFTKEGLAFWAKYGITEEDLKYEEITEIQYFWTRKDQVVPNTPPSLCFAYKIGDFYKLYQPYNKEYKFIQDYPEQVVEGWLQLKHEQDLLIITKSRKDVIVLRKLGYEAVSPKSESTMIPAKHMEKLKSDYKRILVLFDNDGKHNGEIYQKEYGLSLIFIPPESGFKDISDFRAGTSEEEAKQLLKQLTNERQ
jgi:hypothetical protein